MIYIGICGEKLGFKLNLREIEKKIKKIKKVKLFYLCILSFCWRLWFFAVSISKYFDLAKYCCKSILI